MSYLVYYTERFRNTQPIRRLCGMTDKTAMGGVIWTSV